MLESYFLILHVGTFRRLESYFLILHVGTFRRDACRERFKVMKQAGSLTQSKLT